MSSILDEIYAAKRVEVRARRAAVSPMAIVAEAGRAPKPRDFVTALRARRPAIVAEIKRASPSKGDIMPGLDPANVAREYVAAGAAAISVLTDVHFKGTLEDLRAVRAAVEVPLLRKDFIFEPYQVYEARAAGADCILLIAAMLKEGELRSLAALARELRMATLVESHDAAEFSLAGKIGAELIGINNRDLHTFVTDIAVTERLLAGYKGESLSCHGERNRFDRRHSTPRRCWRGCVLNWRESAARRQARRETWRADAGAMKVRVKICGITRVEDARAAIEAGADMIGLNFYAKTPRFVDVDRAREIREAIGARAVVVGVFVNAARAYIDDRLRTVSLDMIQFSGYEDDGAVAGWPVPSIVTRRLKNAEDSSSRPHRGDYVLYDAFDAKLHGGTGIRISIKSASRRRFEPRVYRRRIESRQRSRGRCPRTLRGRLCERRRVVAGCEGPR